MITSLLLLSALITVPIEEVAQAYATDEAGQASVAVDWCAVLTRASLDSRWSFQDITLAPKLYTCRTAAVIGAAGSRPLRIRGTGPADWSSSLERGSILFWPYTLDKPAVTVLAGGTIIEGIKFQSQGPKLAAPGFPAALRLHARTTLRDVSVFNWRTSIAAIHIHGNGAALGTDASLMRFDGVKVNGVWGDGVGFYIHGADANAGLFEQLSVVNVQNASAIVDGSQLGNTYTACHIHPAEKSEKTGGVNRSPPILATGRGARSLFLGCYQESGTAPSEVVPPNMFIGGPGRRGVKGGGLVLSEGELRGVRIRAPVIAAEKYSTAARDGLQDLVTFEVNDGPAEADIDTVKASYDPRLNFLTDPPSPLRSTYGSIVWLWKGQREVMPKWSLRVARGEWHPPLQ